MSAFCTYCSADKDKSSEILPAIQRYRSKRIKSVYAVALSVGVDFLILSGEHGILRPCDPIPYYDHLLKPSEVDELSEKVARQLETLGERELIFFTVPISQDHNLTEYLDCIEKAAQKVGVSIKIVELPSYSDS